MGQLSDQLVRVFVLAALRQEVVRQKFVENVGVRCLEVLKRSVCLSSLFEIVIPNCVFIVHIVHAVHVFLVHNQVVVSEVVHVVV